MSIYDPLLPFFGSTTGGPILPQWYTNVYTQAQVQKAIAQALRRIIASGQLTNEKVNQILAILQDLQPEDISALVARVAALEVTVAEIIEKQELTDDVIEALTALVNSFAGAIEALELSQVEQDVAIEALQDRADVTDTAVEGLTTALGTTNGNVTALTGRVTTLETTVGGLETSVNDAVETANNASEAAQDALDEVATYDGRLTALETTVDGLETSVNEAVEAAEEAAETVASYDGRLTAVESSSASNAANITALDGEVDTLSSSVSALTIDVSGAVSDVAAMNSRVTSLETSQGTQDTAIADLETLTAAQGLAIDANTTAVNGLSTDVSNIDSELTMVASEAATANVTATAAQSASTANASAISTHTTQIGNLQTTVGTHTTQIGAINAKQVVTATSLAATAAGGGARLTSTGTRTLIDGTASAASTSTTDILGIGGTQVNVSAGTIQLGSVDPAYGVTARIGQDNPGYQLVPFRLGNGYAAASLTNRGLASRLRSATSALGSTSFIVASTVALNLAGNDALLYRNRANVRTAQGAIDGRTWGALPAEGGQLIPILGDKPAPNSPINVYYYGSKYSLTDVFDLSMYFRSSMTVLPTDFDATGYVGNGALGSLIQLVEGAPNYAGDRAEVLKATATGGSSIVDVTNLIRAVFIPGASPMAPGTVRLYKTAELEDVITEFSPTGIDIQFEIANVEVL